MRSSRLRAALSTLTVLLVLALAASTTAGPAQAAGRLPSKKVWLHDVAVAMKPAIPYLNDRVDQGGSNLAIVLDIDNTSIATHYAWPRPVKATLAFAQRAHRLGVKTFFVTGRMDANAKAQRPVLRKAGYSISGICGRRSGESLVKSKTRCRKALVKRGYTIIASVGNLPSDFKGGYYERKFDLPDYDHALS
ncbi:HAD family acid phosphatase [Nocardioides sp.]|uniref:HAD family acid phosphatase n=1 Tax=Nocardioides sp. TaxID=35761 RepID=UPI0026020320|nr:HAD family acid phosphatase [Nocardioides sp.]